MIVDMCLTFNKNVMSKSVLMPFKKFWQMRTIGKAFTAFLVGVLGILCSSWIENVVAFGVCEVISALLLVFGCILVCKATWKETDWTSKLMLCASFGAVALLATEMVVHDITPLFNIELPIVTGWYIIPSVAILLVACIVMLAKSSKTTF